MKHILLSLLTLAILSCNNTDTGKNTAATDTDTTSTDSLVAASAQTAPSCYQNINGKDTVLLSISGEAITVTGLLSYNYYEKDKSSGDIQGNMYGDTLIADYSFQSEGTTSVREVAFLKRDDTFVEGYGDVELRNDSVYFKYPTTLRYEDKHPFVEGACK